MKNFNKIIFQKLVSIFFVSLPVLFFSIFFMTGISFANNCETGKLCNPLQYKGDLQGLIVYLLNNAIIPIGAIVAACFIIYSGFLFIQAQGNDEKIKTAKKTFFYTVIGTLVLLGATVIANIIKATVDQLRSN